MASDVLIIGGTGTLGTALIPRLKAKKFNITVLSREELKQKQLISNFPYVKTLLGDIRDYDSIERACYGKTVVFHLAAMKHVDMAEANIEESIKINLQGTLNVAKACLKGSVGFAHFSSTDKAVLPINVYGMCKGLSEKVWRDYNRFDSTRFNVFRWGNVIGSRGSVIHNFVKSLKEEGKVYITDTKMTRFWIHIDDVAKFLADEHDIYNQMTDALIPPMKGSTILRLAEMTAFYLGTKFKVEKIPVRPGEKIHECLDYHDGLARWDSDHEAYTDQELLDLIARTLEDAR